MRLFNNSNLLFFFRGMNADNNSSCDKSKRILKLDFEYFITMAMQGKISWDTLLVFLDDLTSTLGKSKDLNVILVKEHHQLHMKLQDKDNQEEDKPMESPAEEILRKQSQGDGHNSVVGTNSYDDDK